MADEQLVTFNIPVLPLSRALTEFAEETGVQVVADARGVHGLKSLQVIGVFKPRVALSRLLAGTGLTLRILAPGTIGLVVVPRSPAADDFSPARSPYASYYAVVQQTILKALCRVFAISRDSNRLAIKLWVDSTGTIGRLKFLDRAIDSQRDAALESAILGSDIGETPPAGFQQPVTLVILQQRVTSAACQASVAHHAELVRRGGHYD